MLALDPHAHCGLTLLWEDIRTLWDDADIAGGVLFSPVEEIYDRYDRRFTDSQAYRESRRKVHSYLETLISERVFAYWFVWNDFELPGEHFAGIKWHRHADEPAYNYDSEGCRQFIEHVCHLRLPVVLEEEFQNTLEFIKKINLRTVVIIPHFGGRNCLKTPRCMWTPPWPAPTK